MLFSLVSSLMTGLTILLIGSSLAVGHAVTLSQRLKLSPLIIGATVVAIGTSLPEFFVSIVAQIEGSQGLSLGNIVGSNIANFGIVLAVSIILNPLYIGTKKTQRSNILLFFVTLVFAALVYQGELTPFASMILLLGGVAYLGWQIIQGEEARNHEDRRLFTHRSLVGSGERWLVTMIRLFITLSAVVFGSKLVVDSSMQLAFLLGRKAAFFGLTVISLGTSLPELATTVVGSLRRQSKLVAGNLIGSNLINMFFIGGLAGALGANEFTNIVALFFLALVSFIVFFLFLTHGGKRINQLWGVGLLVLYGVYLTSFVWI